MAEPSSLFITMVNITVFFIFMSIPEIIIIFSVKKRDGKLMFRLDRRWWSYKALNRPTWALAMVSFLLIIGSQILLDTLFREMLVEIFRGYGWPLLFLTSALFLVNYLMIYNYLLEKRWDGISRNVSFVIIALFAAFFGFVGVYPWVDMLL